MNYKLLKPQIPEIVNFILQKDLVRGFYSRSALPVFDEVLIEFSDLPANTEILVNGQGYRTNGEGKLQISLHDTSSSDYILELEYNGEKHGTAFIFREYVNLAWIVSNIFRYAYFALYAARMLSLGNGADTNILPFFTNDVDIEKAGEDLEQLFGDNLMWIDSVGGLFTPTAYPAIGNILTQAFTPSHKFLSATPDIAMFYCLEEMLNLVYGINSTVSFLPMSRNIFRYGFANDLIEYIDIKDKVIRWKNFNNFLQEVLFNSYTVLGLDNEHTLPDPPTEEGVYLLVYSPDFANWNFTGSEAYRYIKLHEFNPFVSETDNPEIKIGYHIEDVMVKAFWDAQRQMYITPLPLVNYNEQHILVYEETAEVYPVPVQKTYNTFMVSDNYEIEGVWIKSLGVVPYIPIMLIKIQTGDIYTWGDINQYLLSERESLSGVDVFVHLNNPFNEDLFRSVSKTVWLALEKATIPSLMVIGWLGIYGDYLTEGSPTIMAGFKSVHKRG